MAVRRNETIDNNMDDGEYHIHKTQTEYSSSSNGNISTDQYLIPVTNTSLKTNDITKDVDDIHMERKTDDLIKESIYRTSLSEIFQKKFQQYQKGKT
jgi:hypothetical protein